MTPRASITPHPLERARTLYVTGGAATVAEAAREAKAQRADALRAARAQDWDAAREQHRAAVAHEARAKAVAEEAEWLVRTRKLAWGCALKSLSSVAQRLQSGEITPSARDAATLARLALDLQNAEAAPGLPVAANDEPAPVEDLNELARRIETALGGAA